jgi:hypothetical protein
LILACPLLRRSWGLSGNLLLVRELLFMSVHAGT